MSCLSWFYCPLLALVPQTFWHGFSEPPVDGDVVAVLPNGVMAAATTDIDLQGVELK